MTEPAGCFRGNGAGPGHPGNLWPARTALRNLRRELGGDTDNPAYIFNEPRVGYRMAKGETTGLKTGP